MTVVVEKEELELKSIHDLIPTIESGERLNHSSFGSAFTWQFSER